MRLWFSAAHALVHHRRGVVCSVAEPWTKDVSALQPATNSGAITVDDFEVVDYGAEIPNNDCVRN
jgi:hypothetical protein